jgi:hypothetical protein
LGPIPSSPGAGKQLLYIHREDVKASMLEIRHAFKGIWLYEINEFDFA